MGRWKGGVWRGEGAGAHLLPRFQELRGIKQHVASGEEGNVCGNEAAKVNLVHANREAVTMSDLVQRYT